MKDEMNVVYIKVKNKIKYKMLQKEKILPKQDDNKYLGSPIYSYKGIGYFYCYAYFTNYH